MILKILNFLLSAFLAVILFYLIVIGAIFGIGLLLNAWIGIPALLLFIIYQVRKLVRDTLKEEQEYNDD